MVAKGVCIQVGLHRTCEYLPIVNSGVCFDTGVFSESVSRIPLSIRESFQDWVYYGVDCDPYSLNFVLSKYGRILDVYFILAGLDTSCKMKFFNTWNAENLQFGIYTITLSELFQVLGLKAVDVLVLDIEFDELTILQDYDWKIKPSYLVVESHLAPFDQIVPIVVEQGYDVNLDFSTNSGRTHEYHFINVKN